MGDLRTSLIRIYENQGKLTPALVVDDARPPESELHHRFEWDDTVAGEAHRRTQAAELIRSVRLVYSDTQTGEKKSVRVFGSIYQSSQNKQTGYKPIAEIAQDSVATQILLGELQRELAALKVKYGHLEGFMLMIKAEFQISV